MDTFEKIKRSWWVVFPLTLFLPGFGFIYIGLKSDNRNWIVEGITYELPTLFYFITSALYTSEAMVPYYIWLIILAALIALIRSIMVVLKLISVYDKDDSPRITQVSSSGSQETVKKDNDSKWTACCGCLILIFIIFAIISIL